MNGLTGRHIEETDRIKEKLKKHVLIPDLCRVKVYFAKVTKLGGGRCTTVENL